MCAHLCRSGRALDCGRLNGRMGYGRMGKCWSRRATRRGDRRRGSAGHRRWRLDLTLAPQRRGSGWRQRDLSRGCVPRGGWRSPKQLLLAGGGDLGHQATTMLAMGPGGKLLQMRLHSLGGGRNDARIGLLGAEAQQPMRCNRMLMTPDVEPRQIGIEAVHVLPLFQAARMQRRQQTLLSGKDGVASSISPSGWPLDCRTLVHRPPVLASWLA